MCRDRKTGDAWDEDGDGRVWARWVRGERAVLWGVGVSVSAPQCWQFAPPPCGVWRVAHHAGDATCDV